MPSTSARILMIDDEASNLRLLERILKPAGFDDLVSTTDSRQATALFNDCEPDLVLTDWMMPHTDGFALIQQIRAMGASDDYLPILVLTADVTQQTKQAALAAGATDFLTKPFDRIEVLLRIRNLLTARFSHLKIREQNAMLEENVRQRTAELERALAELEATQEQVIQQERLSALGTMAGGIAHDFNNSLSIIMGYGELLLRDAESGLTREEAESGLKMIITAAEDGAKIVDRLREFYRPKTTSELRLPVDVNHLIEQAVSLTRPRWHTHPMAGGHSISVELDLGQISPVVGDAAELRETLTNLLLNAVDAITGDGKITIQTRMDENGAVLRISDTGSGMTEEVRRRCLEPFFTTKGERGTGLGLAMVFGTLQRHSGSIEIESEPGKGTTFILRLPRNEGEMVAVDVAAGAFERSLHILVVDDQPLLCQVLCEYLQNDCHTVEIALNGREALEKYANAQFDVVITDQAMPEMNGYQLATALKRVKPAQPVVLLTGYGEQTDSECEAIDLFLSKPVSLATLRNALVQVTNISPAT